MIFECLGALFKFLGEHGGVGEGARATGVPGPHQVLRSIQLWTGQHEELCGCRWKTCIKPGKISKESKYS